MYRTNERPIEIVLNIDENERHLPKLSDPKYQYSQLFKRQGFIKYYAAGVAIQFSDDFRRSLNREDKNPMFTTPLVLCLSVDSKIQPNNEYLFKTYRRVYIPFGVEIQSIKLDNLAYANFPQKTDFTLINIESCTVDLKLKQAKIAGTVGVDFTLEESVYDKMDYFNTRIEPLYAHVENVMMRPDLNLYENDFIAAKALKMAQIFLKNLDLLHSDRRESNRSVREKLIDGLIDGDKLTLMPNGEVILSERTEDDTPVKRQPFAAGMYEYKGAYFKDRFEFESFMRNAEICGETEESIIASQKLANRYEYMMYFLTEEQRIHEITEEEINSSDFVIYAMNEEDYLEYDRLSRLGEKESEKEKAARFDLVRAAKLRWKVAHGRI
jgi:hypothetical protein